MNTDESSEQLWDRLSHESGRAYEAFKVYMFINPAERTVVRAWREWTGNPDAKREPPYFYSWARHHAWSQRARAHDRHLGVIRESGMEEAVREEAKRQARQIELVRGRFNELMAIAAQRAVEVLEDEDFLKQLRPADVLQIMKLHLETTHKLGGGQVEEPSARMVDWSEDEQRELNQIMGEIDSETGKEEEAPGTESGEDDGSEEGPIEQT